MKQEAPGDRAARENVEGRRARRRHRMKGVGLFGMLLLGFMGALAGLGTFTFGYAKGASYLVDDPKVCANCHVMQEHYDAWQKSSHHAVATCNDCHLPAGFVGHWWVKGDNGFFHSLAFTLGNYHDPIQIKPRNRLVTQNACLHCHTTTVHEMLPTGKGLGAGSEMLMCVSCHADVGHAGRRRGSTGYGERDPYRRPE